jgi:hypothetical protein
VYKDEPTILAWNLTNEPRCESWLPANKDCNAHVQVTYLAISLFCCIVLVVPPVVLVVQGFCFL